MVRCSHNHCYLVIRLSPGVPVAVSVADCPERELGALRFAPSSTPTPSRSTSSPPSQPVTNARTTPTIERIYAMMDGLACAFSRMSQLTMNNTTMTTLPTPCHRPSVLARVPAGIASQSIRPKMAASRAPITPAVIIQKATSEKKPLPVIQWMMSKISDVASNPNGNTISMGWIGCPKALTLLSIISLLASYPPRTGGAEHLTDHSLDILLRGWEGPRRSFLV